MSFPTSYNTSSFISAVSTGNVPVCVFGDSLIAGQPASTAQGWDNLFYGLLRNWSLTPLRGFSVDHWKDATQYTPSPDQSGDVTWPNGAHTQKKPNFDNTWTTSTTPETGVLGMLNGLEITGQTAGTTDLVQFEWDATLFSALSGTPVGGVLRSTALQASAIMHHHTDGMDAQLILNATGGNPANVNVTINTASGSGIFKATTTPTIDASAATALRPRLRQTAAMGDQSGKYGRLAHVVIEDAATTGVTLYGCGIGGADIRDITNELGDTPAGLCDDSALSAYRTAIGSTTAIIMVGRNDQTDTEANINSYYDAMLTRYAAAGFTDILMIGNYWDQTITQAAAIKLNQAAYDAAVDHGTANVSFVSLYNAMNGDQIGASLLQDSTHPTQAGADYLAGLLLDGLTASTSPIRRIKYGVGLGIGL